MERNVTTSVNRNIYSYQASVNNNYTESNRMNNNSYALSNQALSDLGFARTNTNENANLLEILQNATDDSNIEETSNQDNDDNIYRDIDYNCFRDQSLLSGDYSSNLSNDDFFETKYYSKQKGRPSSAPTKPNNDADEFKYSTQFFCLEKVIQCSNGLIMRSDGKFDVDSEEGSELFKFFLEKLEVLIRVSF